MPCCSWDYGLRLPVMLGLLALWSTGYLCEEFSVEGLEFLLNAIRLWRRNEYGYLVSTRIVSVRGYVFFLYNRTIKSYPQCRLWDVILLKCVILGSFLSILVKAIHSKRNQVKKLSTDVSQFSWGEKRSWNSLEYISRGLVFNFES